MRSSQRSIPELATANLYTAYRLRRDRRGSICSGFDCRSGTPLTSKGRFRNWEPLLDPCYARLPVCELREHALAIARVLLERGASPNADHMAGDAVYSVLTGVAGEGEQDVPPHPSDGTSSTSCCSAAAPIPTTSRCSTTRIFAAMCCGGC